MPDRQPTLRTFLGMSHLSSLQFVMLELTNGSQTMKSVAKPSITLTSKSSYLWAGILEAAARSSQAISWNEFRSGLERSMADLGGELATHYRNYDPLGPESGDMRLFHGLLAYLRINTQLSVIEDNVRRAYADLVAKGLIEDPIKSQLRRGLAIAVLSLIPVSFTNTTKDGQRISMEIKSIAATYKESSTTQGTKSEFEFRLLKLVQAFQRDIVNIFDDTISDADAHNNHPSLPEATDHAKAKGKKRVSARH